MCISFPLHAQHVYLNLGRADSLFSETLQEYRPMVIRLPKDHAAPGKQYTTLYLLDGNSAGMLHVVFAAAKLGLLNEMIIVGIANTDRDRDMMPLSAASYPVAVPGAENFLAFIGNELIPHIEKQYPCNGHRVLRGQSLSGLFTMYALLSAPELFNGYIGNSAGWYGDMDTFFSSLADQAFERPERFDGKVIFMANSLTDPLDPHQHAHRNMNAFSEKLDAIFSGRLNYKYVTYDAYGHVPYPALYDGLEYVAESSDLFKPVLAGNE
jgi:predicted alpha/beta superfamily hydrolase